MVCNYTLLDIKEKLKENNKISIFDNKTIKAIDNYFNNFDKIDLFHNNDLLFKEIKLDKVFNQNELKNLYLSLNYNDYLSKYCIIYHLLNFECFKIPKKTLEKLFNNCFRKENYLYSYNFDFQYNCVHIDNIITFEQLINISNFFSKYNILISFEFPNKFNENNHYFDNEIIITFENCSISNDINNNEYVNFYYQELPNKYIRSY